MVLRTSSTESVQGSSPSTQARAVAIIAQIFALVMELLELVSAPGSSGSSIATISTILSAFSCGDVPSVVSARSQGSVPLGSGASLNLPGSPNYDPSAPAVSKPGSSRSAQSGSSCASRSKSSKSKKQSSGLDPLRPRYGARVRITIRDQCYGRHGVLSLPHGSQFWNIRLDRLPTESMQRVIHKKPSSFVVLTPPPSRSQNASP